VDADVILSVLMNHNEYACVTYRVQRKAYRIRRYILASRAYRDKALDGKCFIKLWIKARSAARLSHHRETYPSDNLGRPNTWMQIECAPCAHDQ
jgi:hypothetical protein